MDPVQPTATQMTMETPQTPSKQEEQVMRLRGGGACADCLAYEHLSFLFYEHWLTDFLVSSCAAGLQTNLPSAVVKRQGTVRGTASNLTRDIYLL